MKVKYKGNRPVNLCLGDRRIKVNPGDELNLKKKEYKSITDKDLFKPKKKKKKEQGGK